MSSTYIAVVLIIVVALLILMSGKLKFHAVLALYLATVLLGFCLGVEPSQIPVLLNQGFGDTCKSVGLVILTGSLLGLILSKTGAISKLTTTLIGLCGEKRVVTAAGLSAWILGVAVFPDTVSLILIPLCTSLAAKTGISMMAFAAVIQISITSGSLVPPAPGPVAGATALGLPLGVAIPWGLLVTIPSVICSIIYANTLKNKDAIALNPEFLGSDTEELKISLGKSITPILLPLLLIILNTVTKMLFPDSFLSEITGFVGAPLSALVIGCFTAVFLQVPHWWENEDCRSSWITQAAAKSAGPVFITALGGSLAAFIKSAGVAQIIAEMVVNAHVPGIFVPMLIGCLIRVVTGSNTLAVSTSAALCQPMLEILGISPLACFLAISSGAICFSHANSSGFWLTTSMTNMEFKQGLRSVGVSTAIGGISTSIFTLILYFAGII